MNRTTLKKSPAAEIAILFAKLDRGACELEHIVVGLVPMSPGTLVVLAVCVVVAALSAADFVARQHHRHALREHQRSDKVARLPCAQFIYLRVIGRPLRSSTTGCCSRRRDYLPRSPHCAYRCTRPDR